MAKDLYEVSLVSPLYNEEDLIEKFYQKAVSMLETCGVSYEIILVDDGSTDGSFEKLRQIKESGPQKVTVVKLARNFGHQLAITAGIRQSQGKAVVVMDSDLQDPLEVVPQFIEKWKEGYDIVYGIRTERKGETFFKKISAKIFYKLMKFATRFEFPENVGDFYLMDRKVVDVFNTMQEHHRFIRGMVAWMGFKRHGIGYVREARAAGKTKFGFWRMIKFSFDAATSFSFLPLRAIAFVGLVISALSFLGILLTIYLRLFTTVTITGWSSLMTVVLFIGGIQLLSVGLIGEYVARIGDDVKARPLYTIQQVL